MRDDIIPDTTNGRSLPLLELVDQALEKDDPSLIAEVVHHRLFHWSGQDRWLTFPEFLEHLAESQRRTGRYFSDEVLELAVDLTIERFVFTPGTESHKQKGPPGSRTDCRRYYRAFLNWVKSQRQRMPREKVQREAWVFQAFAGFVKRQFLHSCQEAKRRIADRFSSRYNWPVDDRGSITVRLPRTLVGSQRRKWLESNIIDVDPSRPGERSRVQSIIDNELIFGQEVSLDQGVFFPDLVTQPPDWNLIELDGLRFPELVAEEKVQAIHLQRPSIQRMGSDDLRRFILMIFDNLVSESLTEEALAELFGLTKTAFSHFAGSDWYRDGSDGIIHVPDLWANVMYLLVHHPLFTEAAQELGLLDEARAVLKRVKCIRLRTERP